MTIPQSIFSAVLVTGLAASVYSAGMQTVSSTISEVTVHQDRARVTRVGSITLPQDETVLEFGGLPASNADSANIADSGDMQRKMKRVARPL